MEVVNRAKEVALSAGSDLVISIGGGSVIDSGKAAAALIPNEGAVLDYLEVIGKGLKLKEAPLHLHRLADHGRHRRRSDEKTLCSPRTNTASR